MESKTLALFLTFLLGLFIVIGAALAFFFKKNKKVLDYLFALAFSILSMLAIFDLLEETIECFSLKYIYLFIIFTGVGMFFFKLLDHFIPEHHDHKMNNKELKQNVIHIGTLTTIALILHNIIEGMAIYFVASTDLSLGIIISLGVGLHNIPLGMIISSTFYQSDDKESRTYIYLVLLTISTFIGGLIPYIFNLKEINSLIMGSLLSLTLGMIIYIIIFELLPKVKESKNKKVTIYGIITGIILFLCTLLFE